MITVKFFQQKQDRTDAFYKINQKISSFIKNKIDKKVNLIEDNSALEIVASDSRKIDKGDIKVELVYRKTITINNSDLLDRDKVDRLITEVKDFCDQTISIEKFCYIPLHLRTDKEQHKNATK
jgi:hypothetical protein